MSNIKAMVVDDSGVYRGFWSQIISKEADMEVVTTAINGKVALEALKYHTTVNLVVLDLEMPEMDGLQAIPELLKVNPNLKIIMASGVTNAASKVTIECLSVGAHDFVQKPSSMTSLSNEACAEEIVRKIRDLFDSVEVERSIERPEPSSRPATRSSFPTPQMVAVGSSTGGPAALGDFFSNFPVGELKVPVFVVQHMPEVFTRLLAERLEQTVGYPVHEAKDGTVAQPGEVYIAPGDFHMRLKKNDGNLIIELDQGAPVNFCRPAVDVLFESLASVNSGDCAVVVLTGMGHDGARGAELLKRKGCPVFIQDEKSSVVWGMPRAVAELGIQDFEGDASEVALELRKLFI